MRKAAIVLGWIAVLTAAGPGAGSQRAPYAAGQTAAAASRPDATAPENTVYVDEKCHFLPEPATAGTAQSPRRNKKDAACHVEISHHSDHWEQEVVGNDVLLNDVKVHEKQYVLHDGAAQPELFVVEETVPTGWTIDSNPAPAKVDGNTAYFHAWVRPGEDVHLHVGMRQTKRLASKSVFPLGPGTGPQGPPPPTAPPAVAGGEAGTANEADQENAHAAPIPTLQVTAREVLLDVTVTDAAGHPIAGLQPADITVSEDGAPQKILRFDEKQPMADADVTRLQSAPALPPNTFTNYMPVANTNARTVILLDAQDTPLLTQQYLREQLIAYLKQMKPGAQIAIFQLTDEIRLIQGFTSDQKTLLAAAESKRDMPSLEGLIRGNRYQYLIALHESVRDAMQMMGRYLAGFPGRKSLIWFTADLPLYTGQNPLSLIGSGHEYPFKDTFDLNASPDDPGSLADEQTLSRVAVYPVDSRGLEGGALMERMSRDIYNMGTIAEATGGKYYFNNNDLKGIIAEVVNDGSNYYTVSYAPSNQNWNGEFRHIKVTVNRPGARVQNREGYYANNRGEQEEKQAAVYARREAKAAGRRQEVSTTQSTGMPAQPEETGALVAKPKGGFEAAMLLGAIPPTEIVFTASLAPAGQAQKLKKGAPMPPYNYLRVDLRGKPFRIETILFQADIHRVRLVQTPDGVRHGTVDFVTVVYEQDGMPVNALRSTAELNVSESTYRSLLRNGLPMRQEIAVPVKGNFFLRLGVHDEASDRIGALEIPVDQIRRGVAGRGL
jgi:VWFA-related protein